MLKSILKNHSVHPVPLGKGSELPEFFHISVQTHVSSTIHMQRKGPIKSFPYNGLLLPLYEIIGGTCKINIEMSRKSRSNILDLDHVKLSLKIFFWLACLMESLTPAFRIYLYFGQTHTPKSRKFNFLRQ